MCSCPFLIATFISDLFGLLLVASIQKLNLWNRYVLAWIGGLTLAVAVLIWHFSHLDAAAVAVQSALLANATLLGLITLFLLAGARRKLPLYETFIEGAKRASRSPSASCRTWSPSSSAVGALRASGALEALLGAIKSGVAQLNLDTRWVDGLPTALIKPLSGGGARGMMVETMKTLGRIRSAAGSACIIQGSTETTFYVLAVYFGSVGVKKTRHALACAPVGRSGRCDRGDPRHLPVLRVAAPRASIGAVLSAAHQSPRTIRNETQRAPAGPPCGSRSRTPRWPEP
jgi:spore maturation protein SpmB